MKRILMTSTAILIGSYTQLHAGNFAQSAFATFVEEGYSNIEVSQQGGLVTGRSQLLSLFMEDFTEKSQPTEPALDTENAVPRVSS